MITTTLRRTLLILSLGSAALVPSLLAAADTPPPPPRHGAGPHQARLDPEKRLARLTEKLHLTADQQAQLRPIFAAQAAAMKAIDDTPLTGDQRREKMKQLFKDSREKIHAVLTPEQRKELRAMHQERRGHRGKHSDAPPAPEPQN